MNKTEDFIKYYESQLDFTNRLIDTIKKKIHFYNSCDELRSDNSFLEIFADDSERNTSIMTSYEFHLKNYMIEKMKIEDFIKRLKESL